MSFVPSIAADYLWEVRKGNVPGHWVYDVLCRSKVAPALMRTVWGVNWDFQPWLAATVVDISSDSANDTSTGTGAQFVLLEGMQNQGGDAVYASETIALNGTTTVSSSSTYYCPLRLTVLTAGVNNQNAGTITMTNSGGSQAGGVILPNENRSWSSHFMVPTGKTGYVFNWRRGNMLTTANTEMFDLFLESKYAGAGSPWYELDVLPSRERSGNLPEGPSAGLAHGTHLRARSLASVSPTSVMGGYSVLCIDNDIVVLQA